MIQKMIVSILYPVIWLAKRIVTGRDPMQKERGMDFFYDVVDWVGGYPYEYASIPEVISRMDSLGFTAIKVTPANVPTGCNEFVFKKKAGQKADLKASAAN